MGEPGDPSSLLDPDVLRDVIQHLQATDVDELEIVFGSSRLYITREPGLRTQAVASEELQDAPIGIPVTAPLTGVYYPRPGPEDPVFVSVGDMVVAGQAIALIETMKLFNEVISDISGEVVSIPVSEGDLVDVGQPLLYVRPTEKEQA